MHDETKSQPIPSTTSASPAGTDEDRLWTAAEVAKFLGVHRNWVYANAGKPHLPCARMGGLLRFDPSVIRGLARVGSTARLLTIPSASK